MVRGKNDSNKNGDGHAEPIDVASMPSAIADLLRERQACVHDLTARLEKFYCQVAEKDTASKANMAALSTATLGSAEFVELMELLGKANAEVTALHAERKELIGKTIRPLLTDIGEFADQLAGTVASVSENTSADFVDAVVHGIEATDAAAEKLLEALVGDDGIPKAELARIGAHEKIQRELDIVKERGSALKQATDGANILRSSVERFWIALKKDLDENMGSDRINALLAQKPATELEGKALDIFIEMYGCPSWRNITQEREPNEHSDESPKPIEELLDESPKPIEELLDESPKPIEELTDEVREEVQVEVDHELDTESLPRTPVTSSRKRGASATETSKPKGDKPHKRPKNGTSRRTEFLKELIAECVVRHCYDELRTESERPYDSLSVEESKFLVDFVLDRTIDIHYDMQGLEASALNLRAFCEAINFTIRNARNSGKHAKGKWANTLLDYDKAANGHYDLYKSSGKTIGIPPSLGSALKDVAADYKVAADVENAYLND